MVTMSLRYITHWSYSLLRPFGSSRSSNISVAPLVNGQTACTLMMFRIDLCGNNYLLIIVSIVVGYCWKIHTVHSCPKLHNLMSE